MHKQLLFLGGLILLIACSDVVKDETDTQKNKMPAKSQLVERSELAILMRNMYNELKEAKENGSSQESIHKLIAKYGTMKSAIPTDQKSSGPVFNGFSDKFMGDVQSYVDSDFDSLNILSYNNIITSCVDCHQQYCTGPIDMIKGLKIKNNTTIK